MRRVLPLLGVLCLGFAPAPEPKPPLELEEGVFELDTRNFSIPIRLTDDNQRSFASLQVYFSLDRGKTWKFYKEWSVRDCPRAIDFSASRDGHFWVVVQGVAKAGIGLPEPKTLLLQRKIYVNTAKRPVKERATPGK
jgi:hypothetical protein